MVIVTSSADSGLGSLRDAIASAVAGETIQFDPSLANQTITLTSGQLEIEKSLIIDGTNAPGLTISGNNAYRVFDVKAQPNSTPSNVTLQNLTIANGRTIGTGEDGVGGGIRTASGTTLTVENSQFKNNASSGDGGGAIWAGFRSTTTVINSQFDGNDGTLGGSERGGGAIAAKSESRLTVRDSQFTNNRGINGGAINTLLSSLTVENSTFTNNDSTPGGLLSLPPRYTKGYGGAIYADGASGGQVVIRGSRFEGNTGAGQGGGLFLFTYASEQAIIENSTIINNQVIKDAKGDSLGGGIRQANGTLSILNTTFANNSALQQGGGLWVGGESNVAISNSTFSGNKAQDTNGSGLGGAIALINGTNPTNIVNTTFADNFAGFSAGAIFSGTETPVTVSNTIFGNNTAGNRFRIDQQTNRELTDGGNNLQFPGKLTNDPTDNNVTATITIADPKLGPLQDNGSGILTHALLPGSAAIDAGSNEVAPATDQRGVTRPQDGDNNGTAIVDIGAYEFSGTLPTTPIRLIKSANDLFTIEGNAGQAQLQFQFSSRETSLTNEVGVFVVDDDTGNVNGIAPGAAGYRSAAISRGQALFSIPPNGEVFNPNISLQLSFNVGTRLGFYLVPNSTTAAVQAGQTSPDSVFFFTPKANADNFDHLQVSELGLGSFSLAWEDAFAGGDADFNDMLLTVQLAANAPPQGTLLQQEVQGELIDAADSLTGLVPTQSLVNSETASNNSFDFDAMDNPTVAIDNLNPGNATADVSEALLVDSTTRGLGVLSGESQDTLLSLNNPQGNPNSPLSGVNQDGVDAVRVLGDNGSGF